MNLTVNNKSEIIGYANVGGAVNGIDFSGEIPENFEDQFRPCRYLLKNDEIALNSDYVEPIESEVKVGPTVEQEMINQLGLKVAALEAQVDQLKGGESNV